MAPPYERFEYSSLSSPTIPRMKVSHFRKASVEPLSSIACSVSLIFRTKALLIPRGQLVRALAFSKRDAALVGLHVFCLRRMGLRSGAVCQEPHDAGPGTRDALQPARLPDRAHGCASGAELHPPDLVVGVILSAVLIDAWYGHDENREPGLTTRATGKFSLAQYRLSGRQEASEAGALFLYDCQAAVLYSVHHHPPFDAAVRPEAKQPRCGAKALQ